MFTSNNIYYTLLYLFLEILFLGLYISLIQMELFTGFLWVLEGTIVFIALLLLFYFNTDGFNLKINLKLNKYLYIISFLFFFLIYTPLYYLIDLEYVELQIFNILSIWDNYYESINNININDFKLLYISYYKINSLEFLTIGLILLIGSVACVNLNKIQRVMKLSNYSNYFNVFNYFNDFVDYIFLRKQNLTHQTKHKPTVKIFKKK